MKKCTILIITFLCLQINVFAQATDWAISSSANDLPDDALSVDVDNLGNKYTGGYFYQSIVIDGVTYNDNSYIGYPSSFLTKHDADGNVQWVKIMQGYYNELYSLKVNKATGDCFVTGKFYDSLIIDGVMQNSDLQLYYLARGYITKFDTNGNVQWTNTTYNEYGGAWSTSIAISPDGNSIYNIFYHITGITFKTGEYYDGICYLFTRMSALDGHIITARNYIPSYLTGIIRIVCDNAGNVIVAGNSGLFSMSEIDTVFPYLLNPTFAIPDGFVWKMNQNFVSIWGKAISGSGFEDVKGITTDAANNVYAYGDFSSDSTWFDNTLLEHTDNINMFVAKISTAGVYKWINQISTTGGAYLISATDDEAAIATDNKGNCYIGGGFADTLKLNGSIITTGALPVYSSKGFLIKLNKNGDVRWMNTIEGTGLTMVRGIGVINEQIAICGQFNGLLTFETDTLISDPYAFYLAAIQDCDITIKTKLNALGNKVSVPNTPGDTFQWYEVSTGIILGATSHSYTFIVPGTYYCLITRGACTIQSTNKIVMRLLDGNSISENEIEVFPNPAHDNLTIILPAAADDESFVVTITDITGRIIQQEKIRNDASGEIELVFNNNIFAGTYFLTVAGSSVNYSKSIVVQ